ncbi:hypothetical protein [Leifsonia sp. TF02-11]|uniref:hypothetical protein n=1 Tax=Leifsonia sp. TF02-11 TaxID=2815212 RepID=UPI001FB740AC|nr:hypothetical protein [Leifsonia sp. TF02-11]
MSTIANDLVGAVRRGKSLHGSNPSSTFAMVEWSRRKRYAGDDQPELLGRGNEVGR